MKKFITHLTASALPAFIMLGIFTVELSPSPYTLSAGKDGVIILTGTALNISSYYTGKNVDPLTQQQIDSMSKDDINRFDRSAADNWSTAADRWSYFTVGVSMITPLGFLAPSETRSDIITIGVMYAESVLVTAGLCGTVKNITHRTRPYVYNDDVDNSEKLGRGSVRSFYSGHTAHAFNAAVFTSTVFSDYYPSSQARYAVWGVSLSAASVTGYLRYRAGKHFPTDILAGTAAGSLSGWLIPAIHRTGNPFSIQLYPGRQCLLAIDFLF